MRQHLTYANVMATLAVFLVLGGGAYAAFHLPKNSVRSRHIVNGQVRSVDIRNEGVKGADVDESTVKGLISSGATIPSGVTLSGNFVASDSDTGQSHITHRAISFPLPAPEALTASGVNFAPGSVIGNDDDSDCTGSIANPTAPPGQVCLYEGGGANATTAQGYVSGPGFVNNRLGFEIIVNGSGQVSLTGTWAYTAP